MEAFAQRTPPTNVREQAGLDVVLKFFPELIAITTSSAPSQFINDQPSSLNPFTASLKPLPKEKEKKDAEFSSIQINTQ